MLDFGRKAWRGETRGRGGGRVHLVEQRLDGEQVDLDAGNEGGRQVLHLFQMLNELGTMKLIGELLLAAVDLTCHFGQNGRQVLGEKRNEAR